MKRLIRTRVSLLPMMLQWPHPRTYYEYLQLVHMYNRLNSQWPKRTMSYWDPVSEKIVKLEFDWLENIHAEEERITYLKVEKGDESDFLLHWKFIVTIETSHNRKKNQFLISLPASVPFQYVAQIAAIRIRQIKAELYKIYIAYPWLSEEDKEKIYNELIKAATDYHYKRSIPKTKPKPEVDLRPYVFLRFLLLMPIIPEEILHAMYVQQEAMKAQEVILKESERIKKLNNEHYKNYWTLIEKSKAYLSNFFSKWK